MSSGRRVVILSTSNAKQAYELPRDSCLDSATFPTGNTELKLRHRTSYLRDNVGFLPAAARASLFCALGSPSCSRVHVSLPSLRPRGFQRPRFLPCRKQTREIPLLIPSQFLTTSLLPTTTDRKSQLSNSYNNDLFSKTASSARHQGFTMSDYIDHNLQATYGAEFFDYEAASGQYDEGMLSSYVAEDFGMGNVAWNETWDSFSMTSNDQVATCETFDGFATNDNDTSWPGMESTHQQYQPGSSTALYHLPEEPNLSTFDAGAFQNNDYAFQSSAPIEAHDHSNFDTLQQTAPGSSQWHAQDQQLQGNSMVVDSVLPAEGHQSE
jgi:hypothetical protein